MSDSGRVSGKVAVVTGAGSVGEGIGNGRAAAILLSREGAKVALIDRNFTAASDTLKMIADEGGTGVAFEADVSNAGDCERCARETIANWGRLDILVNNVGISGPAGTAIDVDPDDWDRAMRVNVKSMMLMARYAIPEMARSGGGAIVNIASIAGLLGGHPKLLYPTSKGL